MIIKCIKGIQLDGGSVPIMRGEEFALVNRDEMIFEAVDGASMNPGMEMQFEDDQLVNNFEMIFG